MHVVLFSQPQRIKLGLPQKSSIDQGFLSSGSVTHCTKYPENIYPHAEKEYTNLSTMRMRDFRRKIANCTYGLSTEAVLDVCNEAFSPGEAYVVPRATYPHIARKLILHALH